jgi:hypothetical protein
VRRPWRSSSPASPAGWLARSSDVPADIPDTVDPWSGGKRVPGDFGIGVGNDNRLFFREVAPSALSLLHRPIEDAATKTTACVVIEIDRKELCHIFWYRRSFRHTNGIEGRNPMADQFETELQALRTEISRFILDAIASDDTGVVKESLRQALADALPEALEELFRCHIAAERKVADDRITKLEEDLRGFRSDYRALKKTISDLEASSAKLARQVRNLSDQIRLRHLGDAEPEAPSGPDIAASGSKREPALSFLWGSIGAVVVIALVVLVYGILNWPLWPAQPKTSAYSPGPAISEPAGDKPDANAAQPQPSSVADDEADRVNAGWQVVLTKMERWPRDQSAPAFKVLCGDSRISQAKNCPSLNLREPIIKHSAALLASAVDLTRKAVGSKASRCADPTLRSETDHGPSEQASSAAKVEALGAAWRCLLAEAGHD